MHDFFTSPSLREARLLGNTLEGGSRENIQRQPKLEQLRSEVKLENTEDLVRLIEKTLGRIGGFAKDVSNSGFALKSTRAMDKLVSQDRQARARDAFQAKWDRMWDRFQTFMLKPQGQEGASAVPPEKQAELAADTLKVRLQGGRADQSGVEDALRDMAKYTDTARASILAGARTAFLLPQELCGRVGTTKDKDGKAYVVEYDNTTSAYRLKVVSAGVSEQPKKVAGA